MTHLILASVERRIPLWSELHMNIRAIIAPPLQHCSPSSRRIKMEHGAECIDYEAALVQLYLEVRCVLQLIQTIIRFSFHIFCTVHMHLLHPNRL